MLSDLQKWAAESRVTIFCLITVLSFSQKWTYSSEHHDQQLLTWTEMDLNYFTVQKNSQAPEM